ncbi:heme-binding domain-containing protein [Dokdonia sp.]|uniref:heme-binding domain-containing protein n=1 Tax=Dokdonia sp. TaxID=2024995 RepID=UPI003265D650
MTKSILLLLAVIFIGIQFYRPNKNIQDDATYSDFLVTENAPEHIATLFKNSCYNCHSNTTDYYWYDNISPASWYVDNHIKEAKNELNFSKWKHIDYRTKRVHLSNIITNITENKMPLPSYTFMHPEAKLSKEQVAQIVEWVGTIEVN